MTDKSRPGKDGSANTQHRRRQPTNIRRQRERLLRMNCECETSGWCWPCAELDRLRDRDYGLGAGGRS